MPVWVPSHTPSWKQGFARYGHQSANPGLWKGLVGLWVPGLGPTGLTLRDVSGFGNHGALTNMDPATDWVTTGQRVPWALDFDGGNDYVDMGNISAQLGPGDFSLVTHHKWDIWSVSFVNVVVARGRSGAGEWALYQGDSTHGLFNIMGLEIRWLENSTEWMNLVIRRKSDQMSVWKNGVEQPLTSDQISGQNEDATTTDPLTLGARTDPAAQRFLNGKIGSVAMLTRALVDSEIQQLHADPMAMFRRRIQIFPAAVAAAGTILPQMTSAYLRTNA